MSYKTILLHVDDARNAASRIELATALAMEHEAHLIGTAMTGVARFLHDSVATGRDAPAMQPYLETLRQRAEQALAPFESVARRSGVAYERRLTDDEPANGISLQARYCDLIVLGQYDPQSASPSLAADVPEYIVMNGGCPVLLVPNTGSFARVGRKILVAWNGSREAAKAVHDALPMLRRAQTVEVAVFNPDAQATSHGEEPGADIALYLARQGVKVDVMQEKTEGDVGQALLDLASALSSDLLVMGCYGHSRFREVLLGGATRSVMNGMTLPVMMSH